MRPTQIIRKQFLNIWKLKNNKLKGSSGNAATTYFGKGEAMNNNKSSSGIGILTVVQIVFVILKLCKVINWSWWLVLMPLWIDIACVVILSIVLVIINNHDKKKYSRKDFGGWKF